MARYHFPSVYKTHPDRIPAALAVGRLSKCQMTIEVPDDFDWGNELPAQALHKGQWSKAVRAPANCKTCGKPTPKPPPAKAASAASWELRLGGLKLQSYNGRWMLLTGRKVFIGFGDLFALAAKPIAGISDRLFGTRLATCLACAIRQQKWNHYFPLRRTLLILAVLLACTLATILL